MKDLNKLCFTADHKNCCASVSTYKPTPRDYLSVLKQIVWKRILGRIFRFLVTKKDKING